MSNESGMPKNWGLTTPTAERLYREVLLPLRAEKGIIDPHTHLSPEEIAANKPIENIWKAMVVDWDAGVKDHYFTQLLAGEEIPLGNVDLSFNFVYDKSIPDRVKFNAMARVFPNLLGTQVGVWTRLELKETLGIDIELNGKNAYEIWETANTRLHQPDMLPREMIRGTFKVVATTDNVTSDLGYHQHLNHPSTDIPGVMVLPTFRPDNIMQIYKGEQWAKSVRELLEKTGDTDSLEGVVKALQSRFQYFIRHGMVASDHGMTVPYCRKVDVKAAAQAFDKAFQRREPLTENEIIAYMSYFMDVCCAMAKDAKTTVQIHLGILRELNEHLKKYFGADTGGDISTHSVEIAENLAPLLSRYAGNGGSDDVRIILYTANPALYGTMAQLIRAFPKTYTGTSWWWVDSFDGMKAKYDADASVLPYSRMSVMACDGRKLLSGKQRHEVNGRSVCSHLGERVENGIFSFNDAARYVRQLCYDNAVRLFNVETAAQRLQKQMTF